MNPAPIAPLSRRHFLRGLGGVCLGLPFLEGLAPRAAHALEAGTIRRFGVFFGCNGVDMSRWFPNGPYGALTEAHLKGTANEALSPWLAKLLIPRRQLCATQPFAQHHPQRDGGQVRLVRSARR